MNEEYVRLKGAPKKVSKCPKCGAEPFDYFLRGQIGRTFLFIFPWIFGGGTSAVICYECKNIVGYE